MHVVTHRVRLSSAAEATARLSSAQSRNSQSEAGELLSGVFLIRIPALQPSNPPAQLPRVY